MEKFCEDPLNDYTSSFLMMPPSLMGIKTESLQSPKNIHNMISFGMPKETNQNEYFVQNALEVPNFEGMVVNK